MLPTLSVGWRASALRGEETEHFREVGGMSIVVAGGRLFNKRQPNGLNRLAIDREMFSGSADAGFVLALPFHHGDLEPV